MQAHASSVWTNFVQPAAAQNIFIVAHSYGGVVTMSLASEFKEVSFTVQINRITVPVPIFAGQLAG
jgi:alpha-beta hydrolase superfamily lysophospholipase